MSVDEIMEGFFESVKYVDPDQFYFQSIGMCCEVPLPLSEGEVIVRLCKKPATYRGWYGSDYDQAFLLCEECLTKVLEGEREHEDD